MSLHSLSQLPPVICQMRSAPAADQTSHVGSVTCARYRKAMSVGLRNFAQIMIFFTWPF